MTQQKTFADLEQAVGEAKWWRRLAAGEALFRQGDATQAIFGVETGLVRLTRHVAEGHAVVVHRAEAGGTFAEAALFSPEYHCDAVAEKPSVVLGFSIAALRRRMLECPELGLSVAARLARQVQELRRQVELRNIRSAEERVLAALALRSPSSGGWIAMPGSLTLFAAEIGLTREALYRTLRKLETQGRLERRREGGLRLL